MRETTYQNREIPNKDLESLNIEGQKDDPNYEGLKNSEDKGQRTHLLLSKKETPNAQPMIDVVKGKTLWKARAHEGQDIQDEARASVQQTKI